MSMFQKLNMQTYVCVLIWLHAAVLCLKINVLQKTLNNTVNENQGKY